MAEKQGVLVDEGRRLATRDVLEEVAFGVESLDDDVDETVEERLGLVRLQLREAEHERIGAALYHDVAKARRRFLRIAAIAVASVEAMDRTVAEQKVKGRNIERLP